ncbi:MAG: HAMP domain-containing sensor histidine kinase [Candidatus Eisenbacteria bacterium]|nr:HAMP domain-containing sensor histidine kinase [Candidatus Eisenbacteria bacterium]
MTPERVRLFRLRPENRRILENALDRLGWPGTYEEPGAAEHEDDGALSSRQAGDAGRSGGGRLADPQGGGIELWVREPGGIAPPVSDCPTLWIVERRVAGFWPAGPGPHEMVRMPASQEEIVHRLLALLQTVRRERTIARYEREAALNLDRKLGLVRAIAHDLVSPLTAVLEYLELLADGTCGETTEQQHGLLLEARSAARRVIDRVDEMADAAQAEAGRLLRVRLRRTDLQEILDGLQEWSVPRLRGKRQQVTIQIERQCLVVCSDAERVEQAFRHLVENAHRFSPPGTRISIAAGADPEAIGYARVTVADEGPGIPPDRRDRLFDPFPRREGTEAYESARVGVGLAVS